MASVCSSLCNCYLTGCLSQSHNSSSPLPLFKPNLSFFLSSFGFALNRCKTQRLLCYTPQEHRQRLQPLLSSYGRREAVFGFGTAFATAVFTFPAIVSNASAETDEFRVYTDDANKFQIWIPQDWSVGSGEPNGFKSVTAFFPAEASGSNVTVAITGLGPDFTRMESFGKVEAFAETLVGGLDRSWQRPPGVAAKLIDCKAANGIYYIEYTLQSPGESLRHLISALGMASYNGWYNRLYTVTGQFVDEESERFGPKIHKAVSSFKFI